MTEDSVEVGSITPQKLGTVSLTICAGCNACVINGARYCNMCGRMSSDNNMFDNDLNPTAECFSPQTPLRSINIEMKDNNVGWCCRGCGDIVHHNDCASSGDVCLGCRFVLDRKSPNQSIIGSSSQGKSKPSSPALFRDINQNENLHQKQSHDEIEIEKAIAVAHAFGLDHQNYENLKIIQRIFKLRLETHLNSEKENPGTGSRNMMMKHNGGEIIHHHQPQHLHHQPQHHHHHGNRREQQNNDLSLLKQQLKKSLKQTKEDTNDISSSSSEAQEPHRNLYVANFCDSMTEYQIEELFGSFCEVRRVVMKDVIDKQTNDVKGHYCFVWTGSVDQAICAKNALHNMKINGKKLQVKFAREGSFKITSMVITTDSLGNANRKVVTLRSDVNEIHQEEPNHHRPIVV